MPKQSFYFFTTTPPPPPPPPPSNIIEKFRSRQKTLFTSSKIINNWLGEEGAMSCRPFYFIFNPLMSGGNKKVTHT